MEREARHSASGAVRTRFDLTRDSHWSAIILAVVAGGAIYWFIVELAGGFAKDDSYSVLYSSVMFSHGYWSCAYRSMPSYLPQSGPVYPLVSAAVQWITRLGFSTGYLTPSQIGPSCHNAFNIFGRLTRGTDVSPFYPVLPTAMVAWFALTLSALAIFRTSVLRSTRSIWLIPLAFALTPPLIFCVQEYYHPQDIWALAMAFTAVALGLRQRAFAAGVLWALALMSQPYTLLGVVTILVISSWPVRRRLVAGGAICTAMVCSVLYLTSGSHAVVASLLGTGNTLIHETTWMYELHVNSTFGLVFSRLGPVAVVALVAWWVRSRRPDVVSDPVILLGLLATAWSLRLVFEENLWGYYCMATGVTLVLRDIMARRASRGTIYWLVLVLFAFGDIHGHFRFWGQWPTWVWQLLLAPTAFLVAFSSLRVSMRPSLPETELVGADH